MADRRGQEDNPEKEALREQLNAVYRLYQRNIRTADASVYRITKGAREGTAEEELLEIALDVLEKCDFGETLQGE